VVARVRSQASNVSNWNVSDRLCTTKSSMVITESLRGARFYGPTSSGVWRDCGSKCQTRNPARETGCPILECPPSPIASRWTLSHRPRARPIRPGSQSCDRPDTWGHSPLDRRVCRLFRQVVFIAVVRIVPCLLTVLIIVGADIDQQTRHEMAALQQIAVSTSQIAKDNAAEHARMDKHDERIEEMLDTWPA
jgi:hypothetical protein